MSEALANIAKYPIHGGGYSLDTRKGELPREPILQSLRGSRGFYHRARFFIRLNPPC